MTLQKFKNKLIEEGFVESKHIKHRMRFLSAKGVYVMIDLGNSRNWVYVNYLHVGHIDRDYEALCSLMLIVGVAYANVS